MPRRQFQETGPLSHSPIGRELRLRLTQARDRGVELDAVNKNPGAVIEKHQRYHRRRQSGVIVHVRVGELGKIVAECETAIELYFTDRFRLPKSANIPFVSSATARDNGKSCSSEVVDS